MKQHTFKNSSQVKEIRYFETSFILEIDFTSGKSYEYFEVPPEVFDEAIKTESIGKIINSNVKNKFNYKPL
jgi:hypothetical protein